MADGADDLEGTLKNILVHPVQSALDTVDKLIPDSLAGVKHPDKNGPKPPASTLGWKTPSDTTPAPAAPAAKKVSAPAKKPATPAPKYHKGTDYVPKTGPVILKKGEAVLNTTDAGKLREAKMAQSWSKDAKDGLGGHGKTPPKEISHIVHHKMVGGGHHFEHHHTHPDHHPVEHHFAKDDDGMVEHMRQHAGTPNPGEAEAEAGTPENYQPGASPNVAIEAAASPQAMGSGAAPAAAGPQGA